MQGVVGRHLSREKAKGKGEGNILVVSVITHRVQRAAIGQ